ncbi:hypothetical protein GBF38_007435 [Nibea albiflora]|uniref:Uncharacterized protein n=1 Tax=Nibea albiflora TaxID=240163 RepID=A0ACB7EM16_NIBAL|nr:hypothetical protein GBF38_007435 [Nibea albiflora]
MKSPEIGPLGTLGGEGYEYGRIRGQMKVMTQRDRARAGDRRERGNNVVKRDDNVDKVKLEIKPTDGGAKNVTCQVACGTPRQG